MPKRPLRDNPHRIKSLRDGQRARSKPTEIKELLTRHGLDPASQKTAQLTAEDWRARFATLAPPTLQAAIRQISERDGQLVFYVTSAVWASRLRLEMPAWWPSMIEGVTPAPTGWRVSIQPAAAKTGRRA